MGDAEHALEYLEKARALVSPDTPANVQVDLFTRYFPVFERLGRNSDAINMLNQGVEIAREAGLRQLGVQCLMDKAIAEVEDGRYEESLRDYLQAQREALEIGDRSNEVRGIIGYVDALADIGAAQPGRKHWDANKDRLAVIEDTWQMASARGILASLLTLEGKAKEAEMMRRDAARIRKQIGHHASAARNMLHAFGIEAFYGLHSITNIVFEFDDLAKAHQKAEWTDFRFHLHATAMLLASFGGAPRYGLLPELSPKECSIAWLRELNYVARIKWLDSLNRFKEADELREEYRKDRDRIAQNVPSDYRADFFNHPLYKVPDRPK
jgi:tetratricopeptide (TPR) repeat protein